MGSYAIDDGRKVSDYLLSLKLIVSLPKASSDRNVATRNGLFQLISIHPLWVDVNYVQG